MNSEASVFLVGMMGAGKSTIGRLLAQALRFEFVDADRELEARSGVPIPTIFEIEGEAGFRRREAALLDELTQRPRIVLATGGGAILDANTRDALRQRGLVIYLRASSDEIVRRTRHDRSRPLLQTDNPRSRIDELLVQREPLRGDGGPGVPVSRLEPAPPGGKAGRAPAGEADRGTRTVEFRHAQPDRRSRQPVLFHPHRQRVARPLA
jgi:shikimate kinase